MSTKKEKPKKDLLKERLLKYHNEKVKNSEFLDMDNEKDCCFDYFINVSGTEQLITDLRAMDKNPDTQKIYKVPAGRRMNFKTIFPTGAINRNRDALLPLFTTMKSNLDPDFPAFLLVSHEDLYVELPFPLEQKSLVERVKDKYGSDSKIELGANEYDIKLSEDLEKEERSHEKASRGSGIGSRDRKTKEEVERNL